MAALSFGYLRICFPDVVMGSFLQRSWTEPKPHVCSRAASLASIFALSFAGSPGIPLFANLFCFLLPPFVGTGDQILFFSRAGAYCSRVRFCTVTFSNGYAWH